MLAVDTETGHTGWWNPGALFLVQWSDASSDRCYSPARGDDDAPFHAALGEHETLLFANTAFDVHHLRAAGVCDLVRSGHRLLDIQTLARIVMPERGYKGYRLKDLGAALLGDSAKAEQDHLKELCASIGLRTLNKEGAHRLLWEAYPREVELYGMKDTRLTYDLYVELERRASPSDLRVFDMEVQVQQLLLLAEEAGAGVDRGALARLREQVEASIAAEREALGEFLPPEALGDGESPAHQASLRDGLLAAGVPLYRTTDKSGQLATNKDALGEFADDHPVVRHLFAWRRATKLLSTYVCALERAPRRVHARFQPCVARTSRMSCREPNMQNLPRADADELGVRAVIVPEPGNALAVCDYDGIEVCVLAHYLARAVGRPELSETVAAGIDMHSQTAARVFASKPPSEGGLPPDWPKDAAYEFYAKGGPGDLQRTLAKTTSFSSLYGIGYKTLGRRLGISAEEAKELKAAVLGSIPGYWDLYDALSARVRKVGYLNTVIGRRLDVPRNKPHINLNTIVQGTAAEIMKLGMLAAHGPLQAHRFLSVLVVHDELVAEGPADAAPAAVRACVEAMESVGPPINFLCALTATGGWTTSNYGEAK